MTEPEAAKPPLVLDYMQWVGPLPAMGLSDWQMAQAIQAAKARVTPPQAPPQPQGPTMTDFERLCDVALARTRGDIPSAADLLTTWRREQPYNQDAPALDFGFRQLLVEHLGRNKKKK